MSPSRAECEGRVLFAVAVFQFAAVKQLGTHCLGLPMEHPEEDLTGLPRSSGIFASGESERLRGTITEQERTDNRLARDAVAKILGHLSMLDVGLHTLDPDPGTVRMLLLRAEADGVNWKHLYQVALSVRPDFLGQPRNLEEVDPKNS
jgi:hypothetical protein